VCALTAETIEVWSLDLEAVAERAGFALGASLSSDERDRANHLPALAARRFAAGREVLRLIVGRASDLTPADIAFDRTGDGKPFVRGGPAFSAAHSGGHFVVAISTTGAIGIDIERIRDDVDVQRVAKRILWPDALHAFAALGPSGKRRMFFESWVRAEARAKALGTGLLPYWSSRTDAGEAASSDAGGRELDTDLVLKSFDPVPDVVGCVAFRGDRRAALRFHGIDELPPAA
jgi:4'-phosphopantetheinyl transferase